VCVHRWIVYIPFWLSILLPTKRGSYNEPTIFYRTAMTWECKTTLTGIYNKNWNKFSSKHMAWPTIGHPNIRRVQTQKWRKLSVPLERALSIMCETEAFLFLSSLDCWQTREIFRRVADSKICNKWQLNTSWFKYESVFKKFFN